MARYANNGIFNVKYPTRRKIQVILQRLISEAGAIDTGALYDSVRINANIPALGELEIQIIAMYYFGFLNNGTIYIDPYDFCAELTDRLNNQGITTEIYSQYTEWMTQRYPILQVAQILGEKKSIIYTFEPIGGDFTAPLSFRGL
jgi:hypothetical protein